MEPSPREIVDQTKAAGGGGDAVTERFAELVRDSYWKKKDLPAVIIFARAGIDFGKAAAEKAKATDAQLADKILGIVKGIAFNLASFTWPGWAEAGITITDADLLTGREAAKLNYDLAIQLKRPPGKVADAHWLMGCHALAARDYSQATTHFGDFAKTAADDAHRHLAAGYLAITKLAAGHDLVDGEREFTRVVNQLKTIGTEDSNFLAEQLLSVRPVFAGK